MNPPDTETTEVDVLLKAIELQHGYSFQDYARKTLVRRIHKVRQDRKLERVSDLVPQVFSDPQFMAEFARAMSITVTEMFRDPEDFGGMIRQIIPVLKTYPFARIWHAGCATGEEVYSMAILLQEAGLLERVRLFGTDCNGHSLARAKAGVYDADNIDQWSANYQAAGGRAQLSDYFNIRYGSGKVRDDIARQITFASHNLTADDCFSEVQLVVCRNVLIYFNRTLQERVLSLFTRSLCHRGFLWLGSRETPELLATGDLLEPVDRRIRLYRLKTPLDIDSSPLACTGSPTITPPLHA